MGFCVTNLPAMQTTVMEFRRKWSIQAGLSGGARCLCRLPWEGDLGLEGALPKWCANTAGRLMRAWPGLWAEALGPLHVGLLTGCLGFLAAWRLGSKKECPKASEITPCHF